MPHNRRIKPCHIAPDDIELYGDKAKRIQQDRANEDTPSPKFHTAYGRLTAYSFACGYIERDGPFTLWREHGVYHVNGMDYTGSRHWFTYRTLQEARKGLRTVGDIYGLPKRKDR